MILSSYTRDIDGTHLMGQVIVSALKKSQGGARPKKKNVFNTNGQNTLKRGGVTQNQVLQGGGGMYT